jgi:hypothetical protein
MVLPLAGLAARWLRAADPSTDHRHVLRRELIKTVLSDSITYSRRC